MLTQFQNHIQYQFPFLKESKFFIAVSGGVDSMVLVDLCFKLNLNFSILHCNFNLRGNESEAETQFLRDFCKLYQIYYHIKYFDTEVYANEHKLSIQMAARELRYNWFKEKMEQNKPNYVLTAHHADDNLETFLINLSRGTGLEGLTGIPQQNESVIRPLLPFTRDEILAYAKENNINWKEDSSNASTKYLRNKIRHEIVPKLKELNPRFIDNYQKTQEYLTQSQSLINEVSKQKWHEVTKVENEIISIDISKIKAINNLQLYLYNWFKPFGFTAFDDIFDLMKSQAGKVVYSSTHELLKDRDCLFLRKLELNNNEAFYKVNFVENLNLPLKLTISKVENISNPSNNVIFVEPEKITGKLYLRKKREGDYFYPTGMNGKKKVSKYFKDEKFSKIDKENTWLLCHEEDVVWIIGHRADKRFSKENNNTAIKIELLK